MHRDSLLRLLQNHHPSDPDEARMLRDITHFTRANSRCFDRSLVPGHITASAWILSPDSTQVLLLNHRKLNRWFQPGGHCDGDPDVLGVALKEAREETGLDLTARQAQPLWDVDIHTIPENTGVPEHLHYDVRFLFRAAAGQIPQVNSESREIRWVSLPEVVHYNDSESLLRMARKTLALSFDEF